MDVLKSFKTIKDSSESKIKEKSSIFIGKAFPIDNIQSFDKIFAEIKKEFYDASHHCYAYKLINGSVKFSDSGEPAGTAGIRILNAIEHFELNNTLIIVIRYFGGKKLGIGPLGNAYYNCALKALEEAEKIEKQGFKKISLTLKFEQINTLYKTLNQYDGKIVSEDYGSTVTVECVVKLEKVKNYVDAITEASNGRIKIKEKDEIVYI